MLQRTFVIIKGDAVKRGLIGKILSRFEDKGLHICAMKMTTMLPSKAEALYAEHVRASFFYGLIQFMTSTPVVVMILEGKNAISVVRSMIGSTNCQQALPGTIRGDFGMSSSNRTLVHASRSSEDVLRESSIFFNESDIPTTYLRCDYDCILAENEHEC